VAAVLCQSPRVERHEPSPNEGDGRSIGEQHPLSGAQLGGDSIYFAALHSPSVAYLAQACVSVAFGPPCQPLPPPRCHKRRVARPMRRANLGLERPCHGTGHADDNGCRPTNSQQSWIAFAKTGALANERLAVPCLFPALCPLPFFYPKISHRSRLSQVGSGRRKSWIPGSPKWKLPSVCVARLWSVGSLKTAPSPFWQGNVRAVQR
jgi:hypothetical protein